jgi:hypothetical protein
MAVNPTLRQLMSSVLTLLCFVTVGVFAGSASVLVFIMILSKKWDLTGVIALMPVALFFAYVLFSASALVTGLLYLWFQQLRVIDPSSRLIRAPVAALIGGLVTHVNAVVLVSGFPGGDLDGVAFAGCIGGAASALIVPLRRKPARSPCQ